MIRTAISALLFLLFCFGTGNSQTKDSLRSDTVFLMNGEILITPVIDTLPEYIYCFHPFPTKKQPQRKLLLDRERVFSIQFSTGNQRVFYTQDTMIGYFFTVPEMKNFIYGEQDASTLYKARLDFFSGLAVGLVSGAMIPYKGYSSVFAFLPPLANVGITLIPKVKVPRARYDVRGAPHYDMYLMGFERIARKKKVISAIKCGGLGLVAGFATYYLVLNKIDPPQ